MNDPSAWQGALPFDPQRPPWSDRTALRAEYRERLERLDLRLVGLRRCAGLLEDAAFARIALESPVGGDLCAHLSWAVTGDRVLADLGGRT